MADKNPAAVRAAMRERPNGHVPDQSGWREAFKVGSYTGDSDAAGFYRGRWPSLRRLPAGSRELTGRGWRRCDLPC
jgi:hypothetical protein